MEVYSSQMNGTTTKGTHNMTTTKFSFHDKRVTLQLARLSTAADENEAFADALNKLPPLNFDVFQLKQTDQEILFAEFDDEMEERIKSEFVADGSYVIDLGHSNGVCPLCGHKGCRYIFRITNTKNGKKIKCGSECILTHGLCVKGAETAEHARKALETTIRRHIKKLKIEAWHKDMDFTKELLGSLEDALIGIMKNLDLPHRTRNSARYKKKYDLPKLVKFYNRSGWLNTEKRWAEWERMVKFARTFNPAAKKALPYPKPHGFKAGEKVELAPAVNAMTEAEAEYEAVDLEQQAADEAAYSAAQQEPEPEPVVQVPATDPTFDAMTKELVFG
jgi:hypothetical protein